MQDGANFRVWEDIRCEIPLYTDAPITPIVRDFITVPVDDAVDNAVFDAVDLTHHDSDRRGLKEFLNRAGG